MFLHDIRRKSFAEAYSILKTKYFAISCQRKLRWLLLSECSAEYLNSAEFQNDIFPYPRNWIYSVVQEYLICRQMLYKTLVLTKLSGFFRNCVLMHCKNTGWIYSKWCYNECKSRYKTWIFSDKFFHKKTLFS